MKLSLLGLLLSVLTSTTFAQSLKVQNGSEKLQNVPLATAATTADGAKLQFVGAGLRSKKVMMINVKVYVGQLFVADPAKFKKSPNEALKSAAEASPIAVQLHFLRDVEAGKVQSSFREALEANKIDFKKPEIQKLLDAVKNGGEAKEGKSLTILGAKHSDGTEQITYEDAAGKATTVSGPAGFIGEVFAIWLGVPSDDGVARLKAEMLK
jgi:hypothetical protein